MVKRGLLPFSQNHGLWFLYLALRAGTHLSESMSICLQADKISPSPQKIIWINDAVTKSHKIAFNGEKST